MTVHCKTLNEYLAVEYPFNVIADPDGGYVIVFPDLSGCMTVADDVDEIGPMAEDARIGWIESAYEHGLQIPMPSQPETYSGKFNVRLPKSLHRRLAEGAEREGVSLNTYVIGLLERAQATAEYDDRLERIEGQLETLSFQFSSLQDSLRYRSSKVPQPSAARSRFAVVDKDGKHMVAA